MTESEESKAPEGPADPSSAENGQEQDPKQTQDAEAGGKDKVAYDTYRKVLSEKKKRDEQLRELSERVSQFEQAEKQRQEDELKKKEDYQKLLEMREQELSDYKSKFEHLSEQQRTATKLTAFLENLDGKVSKKYWDKINLDDVVYDEETGSVDDMSVSKAIEKFKSEYPEIIQKGGGPKMPNDAPRRYEKDEASRKEDMLKRIASSSLFN